MIILPVPPASDSILYSDPSEQKRSPERLRTLRAYSFIYTKIRPGHLAVSGALKTDAVFSLGQDPCKAGLLPQAEQGICTQTLCS